MKQIAKMRVRRQAAAAALAGAEDAPGDIISALVRDRPKAAVVAFARSKAPSRAELAEAKGRARRVAELAMKRIASEPAMRQMAPAPEQSDVGQFLAWAQQAEPEARARAAAALARVYLRSHLPGPLRRGAEAGLIAALDDVRRDAEICLTTMVEDGSTLVRRALAEALAGASDAPRHIITTLAGDQPEIAAIVLTRSPMLSDAELVECATIGGERMQVALARRRRVSADIAAALAETDRREVVLALVENPGAHLNRILAHRIAERFGDDGEVRDALLARSGLPATLRYDLVARALPSFAAFGAGEKRIERMTADSLQCYAIRVANSCDPDEIRDLMRHLRGRGALTAALLVRALVSGARGFFNAAAVELTGVSPERIAGFVREPFGSGFAALYRRMGLPRQFLTPFRAALAAPEQLGGEYADCVLRPIVSQVIASCEGERSPGLSRLLALLRRLEAEAALEETRALMGRAAARRPAALPGEEGAFASSMVVIEPSLSSLLSRLGRLEAESALNGPGGVAPSLEAQREILDASIAAILAVFRKTPISDFLEYAERPIWVASRASWPATARAGAPRAQYCQAV
jgi:uncharacterized protein (DUF2336 family)